MLAPEETTKVKLDEKGWSILIITLITSLSLLISGIVVATKSLQPGVEKTKSVSPYTYYSYNFKPDYTSIYYIYVDGAEVDSVEDSDGYSMGLDRSTDSYYWDHRYTVYLYEGETYTILLYATDRSMTILVE